MNKVKSDNKDYKSRRKNAEALLIKMKNNLDNIVVETSPKRLLHELQVLQIILDMQNEELILANEIAETALRKYTMVYDFAPVGYFTMEPDGNIYELNFTGAEILGDKRFSLVNSNFKLFISEESQPVFDKFFKKIYSRKGKESCEVKLGYDGNSLCSVYMEGVVTGDDRNCLLSVIDISGFRM